MSVVNGDTTETDTDDRNKRFRADLAPPIAAACRDRTPAEAVIRELIYIQSTIKSQDRK